MSKTPKRIEPDALYSCCICSDEYSWPKEDLRWHDNALWCCNCFSEYGENEERGLWGELEPFIPKCDQQLAEALAEIADKNRLIEQMREALERTMVLLDAVPTYAQDFAKDEKLKQIGRMVNTDGLYALVRDALTAAERGE